MAGIGVEMYDDDDASDSGDETTQYTGLEGLELRQMSTTVMLNNYKRYEWRLGSTGVKPDGSGDQVQGQWRWVWSTTGNDEMQLRKQTTAGDTEKTKQSRNKAIKEHRYKIWESNGDLVEIVS